MSDDNLSFDDIAELAILKELEEELAIPPGFFFRLQEEDDWSFIIKLHSLLEAAVTHMVIEALERPELRDIMARLEISNLTTGKLAFAKSLELLDRDTQRFIQKLSEVRNKLVHDVSNVNIELSNFFSSLKDEDRKGFFKAFRWGYSDKDSVKYKVNDEMYNLHEVLKYLAIVTLDHAPKIAIWLGSIIVLRQIYSNVLGKRVEVLRGELKEEIADFLSKARDERKDSSEE